MKLAILSCIVFAVRLSSGSEVVKEIKLFDAVDLSNVTDVMPTTGSTVNSSAYSFGANTPDLIANVSDSSLFATQVIAGNDFTVKGYLKTNSYKQMAIMSFSKGNTIPFYLQFSWVSSTTVNFRVQYISKNNQERIADPGDIKLEMLSNSDWLYFTVRVHIQEELFRVGVNEKFYAHKKIDLKKFPIDGVLRLAQRTVYGEENILKIANRFLGKLQDVEIHFGDPSCNEVVYLTAPPVTAPPKICPTQPPKSKDDECTGDDGTKHQNGEEWKEGDCTKCYCKMGKTRCTQFCDFCVDEGKYYRDGATWDDGDCAQCRCKDGSVSCQGIGRKYKKNGCERTCSNYKEPQCPTKAYNGCFCPDDKVLHEGKCQYRIACPCKDKNGKVYDVSKPPKFNGCEFCECLDSVYTCIKVC